MNIIETPMQSVAEFVFDNKEGEPVYFDEAEFWVVLKGGIIKEYYTEEIEACTRCKYLTGQRKDHNYKCYGGDCPAWKRDNRLRKERISKKKDRRTKLC